MGCRCASCSPCCWWDTLLCKATLAVSVKYLSNHLLWTNEIFYYIFTFYITSVLMVLLTMFRVCTKLHLLIGNKHMAVYKASFDPCQEIGYACGYSGINSTISQLRFIDHFHSVFTRFPLIPPLSVGSWKQRFSWCQRPMKTLRSPPRRGRPWKKLWGTSWN